MGDLTDESFLDILRRLRRLELHSGIDGMPLPQLRCSAQIVADDQAMRCEWYGNEAIHSGHHVVTVAGHKINWHQSPIDLAHRRRRAPGLFP